MNLFDRLTDKLGIAPQIEDGPGVYSDNTGVDQKIANPAPITLMPEYKDSDTYALTAGEPISIIQTNLSELEKFSGDPYYSHTILLNVAAALHRTGKLTTDNMYKFIYTHVNAN